MYRYEFLLALRRLGRARTQPALLLLTFTVSITLSLLGWSLFHTIYLKNAHYDPSGDFYHAGLIAPHSPARLFPASREIVDAWRQEQSVFSDFAPVGLYRSAYVATENGSERFFSANLSSEALRLVGAQPLMGRLFSAEEEKPGCAPVILLSERAWRNRFNSDPGIIGRIVKVDGTPAEVVGVMPGSFRFPDEQDMWQPMGFNANEMNPKNLGSQEVVVRLKPGISAERASQDLRLITARLGGENPAVMHKLESTVLPLRNYYLLPEMWRSAITLFALALVFILIGCTNAANLVIIDFLGRSGEHASTLALGIPRGAALRGMIYQLSVLALLAAAISLGILQLAAPPIHAAMARVITPYWLFFEPAWHHTAVAFLLALVSVVIAVLVPMGYFLLTRPETLMQAGASASRGTGRGLWRRTLLIGQVALLTVLGVSAGLLIRSTRSVNADHWGYDAEKIFTTKISMRGAEFPTPEARLTSAQRLLDEAEKIPGVTAAALLTLPIGFSPEPNVWYAPTADGVAEGRSQGSAVWSTVTPHFFNVVDVPFVEGETFSPNERTAPPVPGTPPTPLRIVINQALAWKLWPGQAALGRTLYIRFGNSKNPPFPVTIAGVTRNFQAAGPKVSNNDFIFCASHLGTEVPTFFYVRGAATAPSLRDIREATRRADPRIGLGLGNTLRAVIMTELSAIHLTTRLTVVYAAVAVILCAVGVYSLTVSQVLQRRREFGIQMALGIDAHQLWYRFAHSHLLTAGLGVIIGLAAAFLTARVLKALLFGVSTQDPIIFTATATLILVVSAVACLPSLLHLRKINPSDALRSL